MALGAFGRTRHARALALGAIELNLPEQRVEARDDGWSLTYCSPLPVEFWNAQVSLLTGSVAARMMIDGGVGLLRTLPQAAASTVERLRRAAPGLGVDWPAATSPGQVIASLDLADPHHVAFADLAAELLRGAGYVAFDGTPPAQSGHTGVGGVYAHATAPIRRLGDRFVNEVCVALAAGGEVPDWVREALVGLPEALSASSDRARRFDRAIVDGTEAHLLADRVGDHFEAIVVDVEPVRHRGGPDAPRRDDSRAGIEVGTASSRGGRGGAAPPEPTQRGTVMLDEPAVSARVDGSALPLGERTMVRLDVADPVTRTVRFSHRS